MGRLGRGALVLACLWAWGVAGAAVLDPSACKLLTAAPAETDVVSTATGGATTMGKGVNVLEFPYVSVQLVWSSLGGSINATAKVQVSDNGVNYVDKTGATISLSGASGSDSISMTNVTEKWMRVAYTAGSVSSGTVTAVCAAKGG